MKLTIEKAEERPGIPIFNMEVGNVGKIVTWFSSTHEIVGSYIERKEGDVLVEVGGPGVWNNKLGHYRPECRVELLKKGDKIKLEIE